MFLNLSMDFEIKSKWNTVLLQIWQQILIITIVISSASNMEKTVKYLTSKIYEVRNPVQNKTK